MYGLETFQLTQREKGKSNAVQMKWIRKILKMPPTLIAVLKQTKQLEIKQRNME